MKKILSLIGSLSVATATISMSGICTTGNAFFAYPLAQAIVINTPETKDGGIAEAGEQPTVEAEADKDKATSYKIIKVVNWNTLSMNNLKKISEEAGIKQSFFEITKKDAKNEVILEHTDYKGLFNKVFFNITSDLKKDKENLVASDNTGTDKTTYPFTFNIDVTFDLYVLSETDKTKVESKKIEKVKDAKFKATFKFAKEA